MHEKIIADKIIEKAKEHGTVKKIIVDVGDLAHLPAKDFEECLKSRVDWEIEVKKIKSEVKCTCGFKGEPKIIEHTHDLTVFECPECKNIPAEILKGKDIILKEVIVE